MVEQLLTLSARERLGSRGAFEVRAHKFFRAVAWADLLRHNSFYIPLPTHAKRASGGIEGESRARRSADDAIPGMPPSCAESPGRRARDPDAPGIASRGELADGHRQRSSSDAVTESFDEGTISMDRANNAQASLLLAGSHLSGYDDHESTGEREDAGLGGGIGGVGGGGRVGALSSSEYTSHELLNFDYTNVSNLMRINEEAEQNAGSVSHQNACKMCKWHLTQLSNAWIANADFDDCPPSAFIDVPLHTADADGGVELTFRENLVRITQQGLPASSRVPHPSREERSSPPSRSRANSSPLPPEALPQVDSVADTYVNGYPDGTNGLPDGAYSHADAYNDSLRSSSASSSLRSAASTRRGHPEAEYSPGSEWIEVYFKNECRLVSGLTAWGSYSYARWWKGLAAKYVRTGDIDAPPAEATGEEETFYSYAELEHEDAGPTLTVGLWRMRPLPARLLADRDKLRVNICLAKAKAFGIKRTVHRISLAYADLVGRRTTITWVQD